MKSRIIMTVVVVAAWMTAAALPNVTYGGDKDWARAGKILTGLAAFGIVNKVYSKKEARQKDRTDASCYTERVVYRQPAHTYRRHEPPPRRYHHRTRRPHHYKSHAPRPYRAPRTTVYKAQEYDDQVIVDLEEGRRIFQERRHGATAYLQVWSDIREEWVSIQEYPSIW